MGRFHGLWTDPTTGLNYARARWYDPRNASFLTEDPLLDADSPNLYAFVAWQPHMATDPLGLGFWSDVGFVVSETARGVAEDVADFFIGRAKEAKEQGQKALESGTRALDLVDRSVANRPTYMDVAPEDLDQVALPSDYLGEVQQVQQVSRELAETVGYTAATVWYTLDEFDRALLLSGGWYLVWESGKYVVKRKTIQMALREHAQRQGPRGLTKHPQVAREMGKLWRYPRVLDPRTGRPIPFPTGRLVRTPPKQRVSWGLKERGQFIAEWHRRGYPTPRGGWEKYDIHHIRPQEFGGRNEFWNLVPVERSKTHKEFNRYWQKFVE